MAQSDGRSLHQIRQDTEQTRADLVNTVEQLRNSVGEASRDIRERIRPATIKSEVTNYARSMGEHWLNEVTTSAREHPLQAVAIGGTLAYPLLRLVRAVPVPVLMIGAGLYLARSKSGRPASEHISSAADRVSDRVGDAQARAGATAAELQERVAQKAGNVTGAVKDFADKASSTGQRYADAAREATGGAVRSVKETAADFGGRASRTFGETIEQNPLVVAGVGLLIGGVIAGALPRTELEDGLLGETSQSLKERAQAAASRGLGAAKESADEAGRRAYAQAQEEGLDPDGLRETMGDVGERVRQVAEAAVTTAFEPPDEQDQSNQQGASHHG